MLLTQGRNIRLKEILITVILSVVFSQFGFLVLLYTVPLYTLYYRRGAEDLLIGAGITIFLLVILAVWRIRSVADADMRGALTVIEMIIPILLMLGMFFVIDIIPVISGLRRLYRLFIATFAAVIICVPVFIMLKSNEVFMEAITNQINAIGGVMLGAGSETYEGEIVKTYIGDEGLLGYMKSFYMKSAAAMYFFILLISARAAEVVLYRLQRREILSLTLFKVPEVLLWPMLLTAVGMLVEIFEFIELGYASPVIWNAGIILMFIYGLQGLGILRSLFIKFKLPQGLRLMTEFILLLMLAMPGVNYVVMIGLPVFGISETWINLRNSIRST